MAILFYDQFQNVSQWVAGTMRSVNDPLGRYQKVATFSYPGTAPNLSKLIINPGKSYNVSFDYLGLPNDIKAGVNLGCMVTISSDGSLSGRTTALAGAITNSKPPMCPDRLVLPNDCQDKCYGGYGTFPEYPYCLAWSDNYILFYKTGNYLKLSDTQQWVHYSFTFTVPAESIRIGLLDFTYADHPNKAYSQDCYFANFKVTDGQSDTEPVPITTPIPSPTPVPAPFVGTPMLSQASALSPEPAPIPSPAPVPAPPVLTPMSLPASGPAPVPNNSIGIIAGVLGSVFLTVVGSILWYNLRSQPYQLLQNTELYPTTVSTEDLDGISLSGSDATVNDATDTFSR